MVTEPQRVFLAIADISGYTKFMTSKKVSLAHAQAIITELIKSIISEIQIPLHIVEIEGDAVFFYGVEEQGAYSWEQVLSLTSKKIIDFFYIFRHKLNDIKRSNMCHCSACDGISDLRLKMITHIGEALFYKIENFSKISGPDVILVHRLLKNSIKANEYLLMSERSFFGINEHHKFAVEKRSEKYKDFGKVNVFVHYPNLASSSKEKPLDEYNGVPFFKRMKQTMKIGMNGMLIMLGLRRLPQFNNLPK